MNQEISNGEAGRLLPAAHGSATACETCDMLKAEIQILADALRLALWLAHQGRKDRSQDWLDERLYDSRWKMCEDRLGQQTEWQRVRDCIEAEKSPNSPDQPH